MITLTERAREMMNKLALEDGNAAIVRAKVHGGGCAGFSYELFFEDENEISEFDEVFEDGGIKIVVDQMSHQYLDGSTIDYLADLMGGGFKFENPKSTGSCGCGNSVSF